MARPFHLELASTGTRAPVEGAPRMMRDGEDNDAVRFHTVEDREAEPFDDDAARIAGRRRSGVWKGEGAGSSFRLQKTPVWRPVPEVSAGRSMVCSNSIAHRV